MENRVLEHGESGLRTCTRTVAGKCGTMLKTQKILVRTEMGCTNKQRVNAGHRPGKSKSDLGRKTRCTEK